MEQLPLKQIAHRIRLRRNDLKQSKRTVAKALGISPYVYTKLEEGARGFSVEEMLVLCDVLKISPEYLLTGKLGMQECTTLIEQTQALSEYYRDLILGMTDNWYHKTQEEAQSKKKPNPKRPLLK